MMTDDSSHGVSTSVPFFLFFAFVCCHPRLVVTPLGTHTKYTQQLRCRRPRSPPKLDRMYRVALRHPYITGVVAATAGTTALAVSRSDPAFAESLSWPTKSNNVLIPSAEATVRSLRLVKTAILMAADYKLEEWGLSSVASGALGQQQQQERAYWEQEVERRQKALQDAQKHYTRESHQHLPMMQRLEAKKEEKLKMQEAASEYAHAEEQLAVLGSRKSLVHRKAAGRLLDLCRRNKGVYIKVGQHVANLDYIVPPEYIEILSSLFDDTPQTSIGDVLAVIREDLGADPSELFEKFEMEPLASASLAQVHVAYGKDGRKLAIKVQHRGLRETSIGDVWNLVTVVRLAERWFPGFSYGWLADEIAPHLPKELDFVNEGKNAERAAHNLKRTGLACVVPKIRWEHTTARVLCMEFEEGFKANCLEKLDTAGLKRRDVAHLISSVFASQVFSLEDGFVHCDPHPANVLVRKGSNGKPELVLVDHGLYRSLDRDFQFNYASLWKSLLLADLEGIRESCDALGVHGVHQLFAAMLTARPFDELMERSKQKSLTYDTVQPSNKADQAMIRGYAQEFLHEIFGLLARLPRQMLLLLKMNDCLRHIDYQLGSPTNTLVVTGRYAAEAVYSEQAKQSRTLWDGWQSWWTHWNILMRIHFHDWTVWVLDQTKHLKGAQLEA